MNRNTSVIVGVLIIACFGIGHSRTISGGYSNLMSISELRTRAAGRDPEAVLVLGLKNDRDSIPLLREIAAMPIPSEATLAKRLGTKTLSDARKWRTNFDDAVAYQNAVFLEASWSAKAALTKMGAQDYLDEFIVQLSTTNLHWKDNVIQYLGYIGDVRAVKHLGPILLSNESPASNGHHPRRLLSVTASESMGKIIHPPFMDVRKPHHEHERIFHKEWKQWWANNKGKATDLSFLAKYKPTTSGAAPSMQVNILRHTEKQQPITIASDAGDVQANLDTIQFESPLNGKIETVDVTMILENSALWWTAEMGSPSSVNAKAQVFLGNHKIYSMSGKVLVFSIKGTALAISEQGDRASTPDEALKSVIAKIQSAPGITEWLPQPALALNLWDIVGRGFFTSGTKFAAPILLGVSHNNSQWILQLQNLGNDKATVVLGADYKAISATVNGQSVYPK